ncbi:MAG: transcription antitermination protein NusB [Bacteroidota bacterium]
MQIEEKKGGVGLLNRRHLRIKVLQQLYSYIQSKNDNYPGAEKELIKSFDRIFDLYLYLLLTFSELKNVAEVKSEGNKKKILPSENDLNPNMKLVNNQVIEILENSAEFRRLSEEHKINWVGAEHQEMFKKMYNAICESETYMHYMNSEATGFEEDLNFMIELFRHEIANFELLQNFFEEEYASWIDDIDLVCQMVIKTLKSLNEDKHLRLIPLYKEGDDEKEFVLELFRKTISLDKENEALIDELTKNWELDRIAKMDIILMKMAITELLIFNNIPTKVTLNEYIEISKFYSTPKSNIFINGVLDNAISRLTAENKIVKIGRGLMN